MCQMWDQKNKKKNEIFDYSGLQHQKRHILPFRNIANGDDN